MEKNTINFKLKKRTLDFTLNSKLLGRSEQRSTAYDFIYTEIFQRN